MAFSTLVWIQKTLRNPSSLTAMAVNTHICGFIQTWCHKTQHDMGRASHLGPSHALITRSLWKATIAWKDPYNVHHTHSIWAFKCYCHGAGWSSGTICVKYEGHLNEYNLSTVNWNGLHLFLPTPTLLVQNAHFAFSLCHRSPTFLSCGHTWNSDMVW